VKLFLTKNREKSTYEAYRELRDESWEKKGKTFYRVIATTNYNHKCKMISDKKILIPLFLILILESVELE
jgi:hypothetical protein